MDIEQTEIFDIALKADERVLWTTHEILAGELTKLDEQQQQIARRRAVVEARLAMLRAVADLRKIELGTRAPAESQQHGNAPTTKDAAREMIDGDPDRVWDANTLHAMLFDGGVDTTRSNVRMILQRLNREGVLRRVAHGRYQSVRAEKPSDLLSEADTGNEGPPG